MEKTSQVQIIVLLSALLMASTTGYAQRAQEADRVAQMGACADACLARFRSTERASQSLATCITDEVPECRGLEQARSQIWHAICDVSSRLQEQCASGPPESTVSDMSRSPDGVILPIHVTTHVAAPRPRRLVLECRRPDGSTFEPRHDGNSSWRDRCECGEGFVGVPASRYAEAAGERAHLHGVEARGEVHRIVQCLPRGAPRSLVEGTRSQLDFALASRIEYLEDQQDRNETQVADHEERLAALEQAPEQNSGLGEDVVHRIVDERVGPIEDRLDIGDVPERDSALSQQMDALTYTTGRAFQRLWNRSSSAAGNVGVRIQPFLLVGFARLSVAQGSRAPLALGSEMDLMISLGRDWHLEAGLGIGYALRDEALSAAMQGVYHAGVGLMVKHLFGIGFGAILTERYGHISGQAFTSDHTVLGGYLEGFGVVRFGSNWAFTPGVRLFSGVGLRFDGQSDPQIADGGLMLTLGFSYFGGGSNGSAPIISDDQAERTRAYREITHDRQ